MSLPLLLYAFGTATKSKRDRQRAASVTTYGQIGGKGPVIGVKDGDEVPQGFVARSAVTGTGQNISLPEKTAAQSVFPVYARPDALPGSQEFKDAGLGGARTLPDWATYFAGQDLTPEQRAEKLSKVVQVGSIDTTQGGLLTLDPNLYKVDKVTPSSEVVGVPVPGTMVNGTFYKDEDYPDMLKKIEELQKAETPITLKPGYQQATTFTGISATPGTRDVFTQKGDLNETLKAALSVSNENETTLKWTVDGKEQSFTPDQDSQFKYSTDMTSFILGKVGDNFDWTTMDSASLNKVYDFAYNAILRQESANAGLPQEQGLQRLNPKLMQAVTPNKYPALFKIGQGFKGMNDPDGRISFERYFHAKARGQKAEDIRIIGDAIGAGDGSTNATFTAESSDGNSIFTIPVKLTEESHQTGYNQLIEWSIGMGVPQDKAVDTVGNALSLVSSDPSDPGSVLVASPVQYAITELPRLATRPSVGSAPNVLANATYNYDPRRVGFQVNRDELRQVANLVQSVPASFGVDGRPLTEQPMFNDKLNMVSVFSPVLSSPQENLQDHYAMFDFSTRVFEGKPFVEMQASEANTARASLEAARLVEQAMSLIFIVGADGNVSLTPFGQGTSEKLLSLSSFYENAKAGIAVGVRSMGLDEDNPMVRAVLSAIGQADDLAKNIDGSPATATDVFSKQFGSYGRATQSVIKPGQSQEEFRTEEAKARRTTDRELKEIAQQLQSGDSILVNAAKRKYLQYVIAYSVASALQGGTGGRTISDQDVQNVLNFLAPGLSTPDKEYGVMKMLRDDLMYKAQRGAALSSKNNQDVYNAMILADLETMADFDINRNIQNRMRFQTGMGMGLAPPDEGKDAEAADGSAMIGNVEIPKQYQDAFLNALNSQMISNGMDTYESINDIPKNTHQGFAAKFMSNKQ
tara:strand:- start:4 stop:2760 length:2757 start_codon:yes stop_codon:yes gene_type:complete